MGERTSIGRIVVGVGGLLLIVSLFLKWSGSLPVDIAAPSTDLGTGIPSVTQDSLNDALDGLGTTVAGVSSSGFTFLGWTAYLYGFFGLLAIAPLALDLAGFELEMPVPQFLITLVGGLITLGGLLVLFSISEQNKTGVWVATVAALLITLGSLQQFEDESFAGQSPDDQPPRAGDPVPTGPTLSQPPQQKEEVGDAVV